MIGEKAMSGLRGARATRRAAFASMEHGCLVFGKPARAIEIVNWLGAIS